MSDNDWKVESSDNETIILKKSTAKGVGAGAGAFLGLFIIITVINFIIENWIYIVCILCITIACIIVCCIIYNKYNKPGLKILITILISLGLICSVFFIVPNVKNAPSAKAPSIVYDKPKEISRVQNQSSIKNGFGFKSEISAVYHGTISANLQIFDIFLIIGQINRYNNVINSYYMCYKDGVYIGPIELTGQLINNTLTLYEREQDCRNLAFMQFNDFDKSINNITGIWQDLRDDRYAFRYKVNLSNLLLNQNVKSYSNQNYFDNNLIIFFIITGILFIALIFVIVLIIRS